MARLFFSLIGGVVLFLGLAAAVWRANESGASSPPRPDTSHAFALVAGPTPTPYPDLGPHEPDPCQQFVILIPDSVGLDKRAGEALIFDVAMGKRETAPIWEAPPPLRDTLWDLFVDCIKLKGRSSPSINWYSS